MADKVPADIKNLIEKCHEAKMNSHSPYNKFRVGAALLATDGRVFTGCKVESVTTLGLCAERCAIFKAVSEGYTQFKAMAIASDLKDEFLAPCGACRQIMYEHGGKDLEVYLTKPDMTWKKTTSKELLPLGFVPEVLSMAKVTID